MDEKDRKRLVRIYHKRNITYLLIGLISSLIIIGTVLLIIN